MSLQHLIKRQKAFTVIELLLAMAITGILLIVLAVASHQAFNMPAERSRLLATKNNLMDALNHYYLNNYKELKHITKPIAIDELVRQGYLDKDTLYEPGRFNYTVSVEAKKPLDQLKLVIKTADAQSLRWMHPYLIQGNQAIWYEVPHYDHIAGSLKYNAAKLAQENDPDDKM
jgi:Tfp pilus assembly protein PilE